MTTETRIGLDCSCGGKGQLKRSLTEEGTIYVQIECDKCGYKNGYHIGPWAEEPVIEEWEESQHRRTVWG